MPVVEYLYIGMFIDPMTVGFSLLSQPPCHDDVLYARGLAGKRP